MARRNAKPRNKRESEARERALAALAVARREKLPPSIAAKKARTTLKNMLRYVRSELRQKTRGGLYHVTPSDRLERPLNFPTEHGRIPITVRSSRLATKISEYTTALKIYRNEGDASWLARFRGRSIRLGGVTHHFVTDLKILDRLADAGLLQIENYYRSGWRGTQ